MKGVITYLEQRDATGRYAKRQDSSLGNNGTTALGRLDSFDP